MAFRVEISGLGDMARKSGDHANRQIPYITARALTATAENARDALKHEMRDSFDRPTPFILDGTYKKPATKQNLVATVGFKDFAGKGVPAEKVLRAEVFGGVRRAKRFERALQAVGVLPPGHFVVPGQGASLDAYGNINPGLIVQILSYFRAFPESGYKANITDEKKDRMNRWSKKAASKRVGVSYFVPRDGRLKFGIWVRYRHSGGSAIKPILMFVQYAHYEERLDMGYTVQIAAKENIERNFNAAWVEAMATAR